MFSSEKIEEWLKEIEQRPGSAPLIIQFIANRLSELSTWNEALRAENISLRTGQRVQEYEQRIKHLEYQLELLKRQMGGEFPEVQSVAPIPQPVDKLNLLVYDHQGKIHRRELDLDSLDNDSLIANLHGLPLEEESLRLLVVSSSEEILSVFTSGRIMPIAVNSIPLGPPDVEWGQIPIPNEPAVGDELACLVAVSKMALADFFIQFSRRGFAKKIRMALAPSIMENRYIGTGTKLPADQTLEIGLGYENDQYALLSREGTLQCVKADMLSFAVEEAVRLHPSDHLMAAFPFRSGHSIIVMTQIGKAIHRTADMLDVAEALGRRGRALLSKARREKGIRVVGGAAVNETDWGLALHQSGGITLHAMSTLFESGTIPVDGKLLGFTAFPGKDISKL